MRTGEHYQLVYLHDYDLLRINLAFGLLFYLATNRFVIARDIANKVRNSYGEPA